MTVSTDLVTEIQDGKETRREASNYESVKAAVLKQKADKDPVEKYRQQASRNGYTLDQVLDRVSEVDRIKDPLERVRWMAKAGGLNDLQVVEGIVGGHQNAQAQHEARRAQSTISSSNTQIP